MLISSKYAWLGDIQDAPKMIKEAILLGKLNTTEFAGTKSNPEIMALAKEADVADIYTSDEVAWCALAMSVLALRAGKEVPFVKFERLRARSFVNFGIKVAEPMFGDVIVISRPGGFHVCLYVGEDATHYHCAGGNQGNQFSVIRIEKTRAIAFRRPVYRTGQPASVKKMFLDPGGVAVSTNEA